MCCRSYLIPRNLGLGLYLICCPLRYLTGRNLVSCVFVIKKLHSDFWADRSIFHDVLQLVPASNPFCSLDVALSMSVSCVHTATSSAMRLSCGVPTADARSSMYKSKRSGARTDPCGTSYFKLTVRLLTPSNVTQVSRLVRHAWMLHSMRLGMRFSNIFINKASFQTLSYALE